MIHIECWSLVETPSSLIPGRKKIWDILSPSSLHVGFSPTSCPGFSNYCYRSLYLPMPNGWVLSPKFMDKRFNPSRFGNQYKIMQSRSYIYIPVMQKFIWDSSIYWTNSEKSIMPRNNFKDLLIVLLSQSLYINQTDKHHSSFANYFGSNEWNIIGGLHQYLWQFVTGGGEGSKIINTPSVTYSYWTGMPYNTLPNLSFLLYPTLPYLFCHNYSLSYNTKPSYLWNLWYPT